MAESLPLLEAYSAFYTLLRQGAYKTWGSIAS
jgi:hypothetical protein